jgi:hypothetical protein
VFCVVQEIADVRFREVGRIMSTRGYREGGMNLGPLVEQGEAEANEDMYRAAPRELVEALGIEAFRIAEATALVIAPRWTMRSSTGCSAWDWSAR